MFRSLAFLGLMLASGAVAGPGLLTRNADDYYRPPLPRALHGRENLPAAPPSELLLPFSEDDLFALRGAGYLDGYEGSEWDREGSCTRYEAIYLLGGLLEEISRRYGEVLPPPRHGPPRLHLPRLPWGRRRVILALAHGLAEARGLTWWHEPPDRFQAAGWIERFLDLAGPKLPILRDPRPYQEFGAASDLPYFGHPMRRRVKRVLEAYLMTAAGGRFRGREALGAREWVRILERLRSAVDGYRTRPGIQQP
jgi:hypothetical protein